jgi:hypothetical protein
MTDDIVTRLRNEVCECGYSASFNELHKCLRCEAADEIQRLRAAINKIEQAIIEEGKMPPYHRAVMKRHRQEWGTLHNAIDDAIKVLK